MKSAHTLSGLGGAVVVAVLLGATFFITLRASDDLRSRLEGALLEGENARLETCQKALPDEQRMWPVCVKKLEMDFDIMARCFRHVNRFEESVRGHEKRGGPASRSVFDRDRRVEECRRSTWNQVLEVEPSWLTGVGASADKGDQRRAAPQAFQ